MSKSSAEVARKAWRQAPVSMWFATVSGIGHLPGGPGTYAAAAFTPLIVVMSYWPLGWRLVALAVVTVLSCYWSDVAGRLLHEPDSRRIVIDEVVGVWVTLVWFSSLSWWAALVGLVAFRIFDITKPPPARYFDDSHSGGFAVVADDVVAGLWAIPFVVLAIWFFGT